MTYLSDDIQDWITAKAEASRVKTFEVVPGDSAPKWHYKPGVTHWKNGVPKSYDRCVSEVTVGAGWLAERLPVQSAIARLNNSDVLEASYQEIADAEKAWAEQEHLRRLAAESARATIDLWQRIQERRQYRDCNPEEARLFA